MRHTGKPLLSGYGSFDEPSRPLLGNETSMEHLIAIDTPEFNAPRIDGNGSMSEWPQEEEASASNTDETIRNAESPEHNRKMETRQNSSKNRPGWSCAGTFATKQITKYHPRLRGCSSNLQ